MASRVLWNPRVSTVVRNSKATDKGSEGNTGELYKVVFIISDRLELCLI